MPYPGTALFPQAVGLYPGDGVEVAPTVVTGVASPITNNTAAIAGSVDPNGLTAHYYVEYGFTAGYGSTSSTGVAGTAPTSVSRTISGLNGASLYHYRMVAFTAAGFGYGDDETFYTEVGPHDAPLPFMRHEAGRIQ